MTKEQPTKCITAKMVDDWVEPYSKHNEKIPVVVTSDHSRFVFGTRLDWGFVQVAIGDGWTVIINPHEINRSNCIHPKGFDRTGMMTGSLGKNYRLYWCPICRASRGILIKNEIDVVEHYPTEHQWDYFEDTL